MAEHDRRILLSADCQVGKTGAFLHVLGELRRIFDDCQAPVAPVLQVGKKWWHWLMPRLVDLQGQENMDYSYPKKGKYHESIAKQRLGIVCSIAAECLRDCNLVQFADRFRDEVNKLEQTVTRCWRDRLDA